MAGRRRHNITDATDSNVAVHPKTRFVVISEDTFQGSLRRAFFFSAVEYPAEMAGR